MEHEVMALRQAREIVADSELPLVTVFLGDGQAVRFTPEPPETTEGHHCCREPLPPWVALYPPLDINSRLED